MATPTKVPPLTAEAFRRETGVSRETLARCEAYLALLRKWQRTVNLVGPTSLADPWRRHFLDSAQLAPLLPEDARSLVDLGAGAGFPGLVLATVGLEDPTIPPVHLVEADRRKAAFLAAAATVAGAKVTIHPVRIEVLSQNLVGIPPPRIVVARALAPLKSLLKMAFPFLSGGGTGFFLKGRHIQDELTEARQEWKMNLHLHPSRTHPGGVIIEVGALRRGSD